MGRSSRQRINKFWVSRENENENALVPYLATNKFMEASQPAGARLAPQLKRSNPPSVLCHTVNPLLCQWSSRAADKLNDA